MSETPEIQQATGQVQEKPKDKGSGVPKWEEKARERISGGLRKLAKPTQMLKEKDAAEADTRHLVTDMLVELLGFDKYEHLTAEFNVKGDWADYGIRLEKQIVAFVEVKRITQELSPKHLRQVESYALREGVEIAILTNGQIWQAYEVIVTKGQQSEVNLIFGVDILDDSIKHSSKVDLMLLLSIEGFTKGLLKDFIEKRNAVSPKNVTAAILSDAVIDTIRKVIRQKTNYNVDSDDVLVAVKQLVRPD
jgi:predicted type IV restriction endonuclease